MKDRATPSKSLAGRNVAFTGRLASLNWTDAVRLVESFGGSFVRSVNSETSLLVIGRWGWPIDSRGNVSKKLALAERLLSSGHGIEIIREDDFLQRLGLRGTGDRQKLLTLTELRRLLPGSRHMLRSCLAAGLIAPVETIQGIQYFDFEQVTRAKNLCDLLSSGASVRRIRQSLEHLRGWLADADQALAQLAVLDGGRDLVVRLKAGELAASSGQMLLEFAEPVEDSLLPFTPREPSPDRWFEIGCEHENAGELSRAAAAYRRTLKSEGLAWDACYNLANVLYAMGRGGEALKRFRQAAKIAPAVAETWNNLGIVLAEMGQSEEALLAFRKALELEPNLAEAHYNLADALDSVGMTEAAATHWRRYLRHDSVTEWADYARSRLSAASARGPHVQNRHPQLLGRSRLKPLVVEP